ncbi:phosphate:H+ symporter [Basidiobolus meristosporus CBS 931.73]|uniref:Phosphate:H+ symporter n=1 Tax=Basidiobolus meristosporus CBS 931.73 TaxID=1314790 RepID=A0A1Y1XU47_9FUNG|nr:phosphate:H+ symporter [Basidiobolus meristosporus CBS 931.73]|eukprot:ORX89287.1 phosphate:H+ symporter [Basidiobolus meristosporus CBS 931.73]
MAVGHLTTLNSAKLSKWHLRAIIVAGVGFFTDAYDIFIINLAVPMMGYVYYQDNNNKVPSQYEGPLKGATAFGTLIGQLLFGYLSDKLGRKKMYGSELIIIIFATLCCALAGSWARGLNALAILGFWRFILGIGIGGDYPVSAVITSEFSSTNRRGMMIAAVFASQGIGILVAAIFTVIVLAIFQGAIRADTGNLDYVWRLMLGFGCVPAIFTVYFRLTMPESPRYTAEVRGDLAQASEDMKAVLGGADKDHENTGNPVEPGNNHELAVPDHHDQHDEGDIYKENRSFVHHFGQWKNLKVLLGTSLSWFFLDIAFYGLSLNQSYVLQAIGYSSSGLAPYDALWTSAIGNLIISLMGTVPGYWFTVFLIERMGRIRIQLMGFALLTIIFVILSAGFYKIRDTAVALFIALFTLAQFFFNFGPNTTTFVLPSEVFPTRFRSTAHGISAASGKLGAIIATFGFNELVEIGGKDGDHAFLPQTLGIFAGIMFLGFLTTFWIPETKGKSLEEISGEN